MIQTMLGIIIVYNKIRTFFLMICFECFLTYFQKIPVNSDKKELRFGQNFNKLYSPKIQLDLTYIFSRRLFFICTRKYSPNGTISV